MSKHQTKTNNSFFREKVDLRLEGLDKDKIINVLECYAGEGCIWDEIIKQGYQIQITRIEKVYTSKVVLKGDNLKWLASLDLTKYDIVDLDAYGVPFAQLELLFERKFEGKVFVTFIQTMMGGLPHGLLKINGITENMVKKVPTLVSKPAFSFMKEYLAKRGVKSIDFIKKDRKIYFSFCLLSS